MQSEEHKKKLVNAYQMAGADFLALKLERVFREIKTDEDRVLHNDMVKEFSSLLPEPVGFLKTLAMTVNARRINSKNYLKTVANIILESVCMKGKTNVQRKA